MVRRSIWYMAEPLMLRIWHPLRLRQRFLSRCAPRRAHLAIGCPPVASASLLYGLAVDCVVPATGSNHSPLPDGSNISSGRAMAVRLSTTETSPSKTGDECGIHPT